MWAKLRWQLGLAKGVRLKKVASNKVGSSHPMPRWNKKAKISTSLIRKKNRAPADE